MKQKNYSLHPEIFSCFVQILVRWQGLGARKEWEDVGACSEGSLEIQVPLLTLTPQQTNERELWQGNSWICQQYTQYK